MDESRPLQGKHLQCSLLGALVFCVSCGGASQLVDGDSGVAAGGSGVADATDSGLANAVDSGLANAVDSGVMNPVAWNTAKASLSADDFELTVDDRTYLAPAAAVALHSDPGDQTYTTLELVWTEQSREMRLFIYFRADGTSWWSEEIRTYDGQVPGDWIYYFGRFFERPLGTTYSGDLVLTNNGAQDRHQGTIRFRGLRLLPSFAPRS